MSDKYPRSPRSIDAETWFYEEPKGIQFVRQLRAPDGTLVQADMFRVPWGKLARAVDNHRRAKSLGGLRSER